MPDYHPLITRAVADLPVNTGEARRALYDWARQSQVKHLRGVRPELEESEITGERLALEDAIRKVEVESARLSPTQSSRGDESSKGQIIKTGNIEGMQYDVYADGAIVAHLPGGLKRFESADHLRKYVEANRSSEAEPGTKRKEAKLRRPQGEDELRKQVDELSHTVETSRQQRSLRPPVRDSSDIPVRASQADRPEMGKAARNERRKLVATFCNNMAVGLLLAGLFLPLVYLLYMTSKGLLSFDLESYWAAGSMVASLAGAIFCQFFAHRKLRKIED